VKSPVVIDDVKNRIVTVRGEVALLDRDVAALYGVETREVNQAVRNNRDKFPEEYAFVLSKEEVASLRSKFLILEGASNRGHHSKYGYKAFTERGLYMLATILKSKKATEATFAIIETFAKVRGLKRELVEMHKETDVRKRTSLMKHFGEVLTDIVMPDLSVSETESSLELNFLIGKIKHTVRRVRKAEPNRR